jgi:hypothetical protein
MDSNAHSPPAIEAQRLEGEVSYPRVETFPGAARVAVASNCRDEASSVLRLSRYGFRGALESPPLSKYLSVRS